MSDQQSMTYDLGPLILEISGGTPNYHTMVSKVASVLAAELTGKKRKHLHVEIHRTTPNGIGQPLAPTGWTEAPRLDSHRTSVLHVMQRALDASGRIWLKPNGPGGRARYYYR